MNINKLSKFTFVDLFAGVGGFRIPLEKLGGVCLGFSEIDKYAIETYKNNFKSDDEELGDITKINKLPFNDIDLIVGGVPCQSWSGAGKMKGFDDPRGKLWEDTIRVVDLNKPKAFIFENVKGLIDPRNKENLKLIVESFESIGYDVKYKLLNTYDYGLPQNRERIYIVGLKKELAVSGLFKFPDPISEKTSLYDIIDGLPNINIPNDGNKLNDFFIFCDTRNGHTTIHSWDIVETTPREKLICMTILKNRRKKIYGNLDGNPLTFQQLVELIPGLAINELYELIDKKILKYSNGYEFYNSKNSTGINGIYRVYLPHSSILPTLTATGSKDFIALKSMISANSNEYKKWFISEILNKKQFRSLTAKEFGRLQGFPEWFKIHKNEQVAKKQFGNAVSTNVVYHLGVELISSNIFTKP